MSSRRPALENLQPFEERRRRPRFLKPSRKAAHDADAHEERVITFRDWAAVVGVALGAFMAILDIQIINASLREIQGSLNLDLSEGGWISTAYLIAEIIVIPLTAFFSEAVGARRYIIANTILFVISSALCGISWNIQTMIIFRVMQGISGGTLIPMSFQTILTTLPPSKRNIGLAIFGVTATLAPTLGPAIGGYLTDSYGWRSIFFLNIGPGLAMLGLIYYGMPTSKFNLKKLLELDVTGAITMSLGLGTLTYVLEQGAEKEWFADAAIRLCFLVCVASLSVFLAIQFLKEKPLLKLGLLAERNFGIAALVTVLASMALYGGVFATAMYLGQVQGYSAQDIGGAMMWIGIPQLFVLPFLPWLMNRIDSRVLIFAGFCLFTYSNWLNTHLNIDYAGEQFKFSLILRALGQPLFMIPLSSMGMALISKDEAGHASAIYNVLRNLGGSIGIALTSTFVVTRMSHHLFSHTVTIDPDSVLLQDRIAELHTTYLMNGFTKADATTLAGKKVLELAYRDSLIQSFGDVFFVISIGLVICSILALVLNKTATKISGDIH
jgi:DHA2 family multidrug resistance protein